MRELYQRLLAEDWIDPWLDEEKLLPGQDWDFEIEKAVEASDAVIVCVSKQSVTKEGYVQKELRKVLDIALEQPEDTIFIIPLRLEESDLPRRLRSWHYVDYFPPGQKKQAQERLLKSLRVRRDQRSSQMGDRQAAPSDRSELVVHEQRPVGKSPVSTVAGDAVGPGASLLLAIYFAIAALDSLASPSDTIETLLAIAALPAGAALLWKRQIPGHPAFKIALIVYLLIYGPNYRLTDDFPFLLTVAGLAASVAGIVLVMKIHEPQKPVFYFSIAFSAFLFLVGIYELATNIEYTRFTDVVDILIFITCIIAAVLLWRDL